MPPPLPSLRPMETPAPAPTASSSSSSAAAWPAPTAPPTPPAHRRRRSRDVAEHRWSRRQNSVDQSKVEAAKQQCQVDVGNEVISCFPKTDTVVTQHQFISFVWNSNLPQFAQLNQLNIFLYDYASRAVIHEWKDVHNPHDAQKAGIVTFQAADDWFTKVAGAGAWAGSNITYKAFFAVQRADASPDDYQTQSVFTAVQTTYLDAVVASMSSASASASSAASAASVSTAEASRTSSPGPGTDANGHTTGTGANGTGTGPGTSSTGGSGNGGNGGSGGNLQSATGSDFPHWAIAVIVVLGFLALVAAGIAAWLLLRRMRARRDARASQRDSANSGTPMLGADGAGTGGGVHSPLMGEHHIPPAGVAAGVGAGALGGAAVARAASGKERAHDDGASEISRAHSDAAPFSGADAAIMADAFRKALRKPDFAGGAGVEEGDTPESAKERREAELMRHELAEDGRDIRSVGSSRDVRVLNASESGHTARDDGSTVDGH